MTKSPRKNVPDVGIELGAACMPSKLASDRAMQNGQSSLIHMFEAKKCEASTIKGYRSMISNTLKFKSGINIGSDPFIKIQVWCKLVQIL